MASETKRPSWLRLQFSLRALVALMILAAVGAGIVANRRARLEYERRQQEAIAILSGRLGRPLAPDATELSLATSYEDDLRYVAFLPRLERLSLEGGYYSSSGLRYLRQLPNLRELEAHHLTLSDGGLAEITKLKRLKRLSLLGTGISDHGFQRICEMNGLQALVVQLPTRSEPNRLRSLTQLESLRLTAGNILKADDLQFLAHTPRMRCLWIQCSALGDVLAALRHVPNLTELRLQCNQLTDRDLQHIENHTALQHLTLEGNSGNYVTDAGLASLAGLTDLQFLNLSNCRRITDSGLRHLQQLAKLRTLRLNRINIDGSGLANLSGHKHLSKLYLSGSGITDESLVHLATMSRLRTLDLEDTKITDSGLVQLAGLHRLEHLKLNGSAVTLGGLAELKALPNLQTLTVPRSVPDETLSELRQRFPKATVN